MKQPQVILLIGVLCIHSVLGQQVKQCPSQQQCLEFNSCHEFRTYVGVAATKWPPMVQTLIKSRICKLEQRGRERIYSVCCSSPYQFPNGLFNSWGHPAPSAHKPRGLDLLDMKTCGKHSSERIAFGKKAQVFEYPWMALLLDDNQEIRCGGSLIAESYVLTAAHCNRPAIATVRLGENDISKDIDCNNFGDELDCADPPQDIEVSKFIKHSLYSSSKRRNDIALIKLAKPARLSFSVKTICLPIGAMVRSPEPKEMIISGWGFTERGRTSNVLQYASVPILTTDRCASTLAKLSDAITLDDSSQLCAGGVNKVDNCAGDSGGPLQYYSRSSAAVMYGVVSFGVNSCGDESAPGVYTRVSHYIDWIAQNLE
ncbi:phenoloxidase-activating factor 3-like [Sabethes cyaneus]|uniref:phenoloxidase-activating factor 3-like n=1 Tax=Sabethes cyaneus TaxID=53552 RepID=UPI00237E55D9|nr:phenoloxidase-activating factor 3-like [Sabethes cyaneus]